MLRSNLSVGLLTLLLVSGRSQSQTPAGFHWVNFKQDTSTVSKVEHVLKDEDYTAIREIGVAGSFALVMTVQREPEVTTFDGDMWRVYNVSMKTGTFKILLVGYKLQVKDWIAFQSAGAQDLGVVYMDCWECEPASLFTALHYDFTKGWSARWNNEKDSTHPGITIRITDVGDPYTNEDVDQVFAVLVPEHGAASAGTWYYSKDLSTGKITESVTKFWVDQATGKDRSVELIGADARSWEVTLCKPGHSPFGLHEGQATQACKRTLSAKRKPPQ